MYQLVIRVVLGLGDRAGGRERGGVGGGGGGETAAWMALERNAYIWYMIVALTTMPAQVF